MPLNRKLADDAALEGTMQFKGWAAEFVKEWNAPLMELERAKQRDQAIAAFENMPEELKAQLQAQFPEQYAAAEKTYRKLKGGKDVGYAEMGSGDAGSNAGYAGGEFSPANNIPGQG